MAGSDLTLLVDEHAEEARALLEPINHEADHLDHFQMAVVNALRASAHAQLALVDLAKTAEARRGEGRPW